MSQSAKPAPPPEDARALLALLGEDVGGGTAAPAAAQPSPDRLRQLARQLIAKVEETRRDRSIPPTQPKAPRRSVFSGPAMTLAPRPAPEIAEPPDAATSVDPSPVAPEPRPVSAAQGFAQALRDLAPAAPPAATPAPPPKTREADTLLSRDEVRHLVGDAIAPDQAWQEHPAIAALSLTGKHPLEQAAALRSLPRGHVRAVHRALRVLEGAA